MTPQANLTLCVCKNPACKIPYGECHCGCKNKTRLVPRVYCYSHKGDPLLDEFWKRVEKSDGCWVWKGQVNNNGYPRYNSPKAQQFAFAMHRFSYAEFVGELISGHDIHHLCENKLCVNPNHLEQVLHGVHMSIHTRWNATLTHCKRGHEFTAQNTYIWVDKTGKHRHCRACAVVKSAKSKAKKRLNAISNSLATS